jgi:hypothetical protein
MIKYKYIGKVPRSFNINTKNRYELVPEMVFEISDRYEYLIKKRGVQAEICEEVEEEEEISEEDTKKIEEDFEEFKVKIEKIVQEAVEIIKKPEIIPEIVKKVVKEPILTKKKKAGRPKGIKNKK